MNVSLEFQYYNSFLFNIKTKDDLHAIQKNKIVIQVIY